MCRSLMSSCFLVMLSSVLSVAMLQLQPDELSGASNPLPPNPDQVDEKQIEQYLLQQSGTTALKQWKQAFKRADDYDRFEDQEFFEYNQHHDMSTTEGMSQKQCEKLYLGMKKDSEDFLVRMKQWTESIAFATGGKPVCAPLKGHKRACEKIRSDYKSAFEIRDIVRCSIVYESAAELCKAAADMPSIASPLGQLNDPDCGNAMASNCMGVVKVKNRFAAPQGGYADIMLSIAMQTDQVGSGKGTWQTGELQLHLAPMIVAKSGNHPEKFSKNGPNILEKLKASWAEKMGTPYQDGHKYYEISRNDETDPETGVPLYSEEEKTEASENAVALYNVVWAMLCGNGGAGDAKTVLETSPNCMCLAQINEQTFNMDLKGLYYRLSGVEHGKMAFKEKGNWHWAQNSGIGY